MKRTKKKRKMEMEKEKRRDKIRLMHDLAKHPCERHESTNFLGKRNSYPPPAGHLCHDGSTMWQLMPEFESKLQKRFGRGTITQSRKYHHTPLWT
jgi:hypothetical protein